MRNGTSAPAFTRCSSSDFPGTVEFMLVDGGSTDGTRSILSDLARRDPRLRVLDNPRGTTPSGLNVALAHARGRWVAAMDGHTAYPRDYLALGVERPAARRHPLGQRTSGRHRATVPSRGPSRWP